MIKSLVQLVTGYTILAPSYVILNFLSPFINVDGMKDSVRKLDEVLNG